MFTRRIPGRNAPRRRGPDPWYRGALRPGHVMCHQPGPGTGRLPARRPAQMHGAHASDRRWLTGRFWSVIWAMLGLPPPGARLLTLRDPVGWLRRGPVI